ncbi:histone-lysine N-methyltransferase, H3 lysine-79 specific-like [Denticeps clupeoides]|uniref:histone-lysine N-methyltransferase, H3 lysine-79 specific-like n=1 Tax=Denticeps clupeoides TaxID=299321 RepID=UPI0010A51333|nr:histone-lysine N-methyltransferase, H3 lysine-79 specific-like [Denticeps clupeoides]
MKQWKKFVRRIRRPFCKKKVPVEPNMTGLKSVQNGQMEALTEQIHRLEEVMETFQDKDHYAEKEQMLRTSNDKLRMALHEAREDNLALVGDLKRLKDRDLSIQVLQREKTAELEAARDRECLRYEDLQRQLSTERHNREEAERRFYDEIEKKSEEALYEEMLQKEKKETDELRREIENEQRRREEAERELEAEKEHMEEAERLLLETKKKSHEQLKSKESLKEETLQPIKQELEMMRAERDHERKGREELDKVLLKETATKNELEKRFQNINQTTESNEIEEILKILLKREKELSGEKEKTAERKIELERLLEASQRNVKKGNEYKHRPGPRQAPHREEDGRRKQQRTRWRRMNISTEPDMKGWRRDQV